MFMRELICATLLIVLTSATTSAFCADFSSVSSVIQQEFKSTDLVFVGELHNVVEHKDLLKGIVADLIANQSLDAVAFEFAKFANNDTLMAYLNDSSATLGSESETAYFLKLNRAYSNTFNNEVYDDVLRFFRQINIRSNGKIHFCAIDSQLFWDQEENGESLRALRRLPFRTTNFLRNLTGLTIQELAKNERNYAREAEMAQATMDCAPEGKKILVFNGMAHNMRRPLGFKNPSALQIVEGIRGKRSASWALAFSKGQEGKYFPFFDAALIDLNFFPVYSAYSRDSIPENIKSFFFRKGNAFDFSSLFDVFVFGPKAKSTID